MLTVFLPAFVSRAPVFPFCLAFRLLLDQIDRMVRLTTFLYSRTRFLLVSFLSILISRPPDSLVFPFLLTSISSVSTKEHYGVLSSSSHLQSQALFSPFPSHRLRLAPQHPADRKPCCRCVAVAYLQAAVTAEDDGKAADKTALQRFFERELSVALSMLKMIRKDLNDLKTVAEGEARSTDRTRAIQASLLKGEVPPIWMKYPIPEITVNAWVRSHATPCQAMPGQARPCCCFATGACCISARPKRGSIVLLACLRVCALLSTRLRTLSPVRISWSRWQARWSQRPRTVSKA